MPPSRRKWRPLRNLIALLRLRAGHVLKGDHALAPVTQPRAEPPAEAPGQKQKRPPNQADNVRGE